MSAFSNGQLTNNPQLECQNELYVRSTYNGKTHDSTRDHTRVQVVLVRSTVQRALSYVLKINGLLT